MRTCDIAVNSGLGATEILRSHVSARAIEAVCRLTANSLDLETLIASYPLILLRRHTLPSVRVRSATE
jgi:hypothetical protein